MDFTIFIDESGNTGEPKMKNGVWNWGGQPYFALGSICVATEIIPSLNDDILAVFQSYCSQLGTGKNEWKSKQQYVFNNELMQKVFGELDKYKAKVCTRRGN